MPTGQQYGTNVSQTFLTSAIGPSTTSFTVSSSISWPSTPFTAVFGIGTSTQEVIDVGTVVGNNWSNVTRGVDGTTATNQSINQTITHVDIGRDFREMRAHIDASTSNDSTGHSVHGLAVGSAVVGTTDVQTLNGKTLASPVLNTPTVNAPIITSSTTTPSGSNLSLNAAGGILTAIDSSATSFTLQPAIDGPLLNNMVTWTMDPAFCAASNTPTSGSLSLNRVYVNHLSTISNLYLSVLTAGSGLTAGQNLVGVYDANGNRVGISADQTTAWGTTGNKTASLTMTGALEPGVYYLAFLSVGTTTPKLYGGGAVNAVQNLGFSATPARFMSLAGQTTLPSTVTLNTFSQSGFIPLLSVN